MDCEVFAKMQEPAWWAQALGHGFVIGVPMQAPCASHEHPGLAASKHHFMRNGLRLLSQTPLILFGWLRHSPLVFTVLSANIPEAQPISSVPVAIILIWNGLHSHPGQLHTTGSPFTLVAVLNSSLRPPSAYHLCEEYTPTRPRHEH